VSDASADAAGEALCGPFVACGGDLVGHWTVTSECHDSYTDRLGCEALTYHLTQCGGSYDFTDSGTFSLLTSCAVSYQDDLTGECVPDACAGATSQGDAEDRTMITCTGNTAACQCQVMSTGTVQYTGTYTVDASTITYYPVDAGVGTTITNQFCVRENALSLHVFNPGAGVSLTRE
jgi:hypothetical protein